MSTEEETNTNTTIQQQQQHEHQSPQGECIFCCDDITQENYVEYRGTSTSKWLPAIYCENCIVEQFINRQWQTYLDNMAKADCAAALRRVLSAPPPQCVKDAGLPCEDNETGEVYEFWFASTNEIRDAKLKDALEGAERDAFWAEKKAFLEGMEQEEALNGTKASTPAPMPSPTNKENSIRSEDDEAVLNANNKKRKTDTSSQ
jgi:hypothetical protein